jgi:nucleoside-diphosphate-sugar epimerase
MNVCVAGAGGFIGGHLVKRLLDHGFNVVAADIKPSTQWYQIHEKANNLFNLDLGLLDNCLLATDKCDQVYNLAADMGGMGFIATHRVNCMESALVTINMLKAASNNGCQTFFYASSACVYNDALQQDEDVSLRESDAWPADPEPGYGMEKLFGEEIAKFYREEKSLKTVIARFHNIFGPYGTFDGGREKAPAAICRKVAQAVITGNKSIEIWGDGNQTRSFLYVDECLDGIERMVLADVANPLNLGSSELVSINQLVSLVEDIAEIKLDRTYNLDAPQGVRGRNSNNDLIESMLAWKPTEKLSTGLEKTYAWIFDQVVSLNSGTV